MGLAGRTPLLCRLDWIRSTATGPQAFLIASKTTPTSLLFPPVSRSCLNQRWRDSRQQSLVILRFSSEITSSTVELIPRCSAKLYQFTPTWCTTWERKWGDNWDEGGGGVAPAEQGIEGSGGTARLSAMLYHWTTDPFNWE